MQKISSTRTFFIKRVFPIAWFGILALVFVPMVLGVGEKPPLAAILLPLPMVGFGFFLMRQLIWPLADEVLDGGSFLVVRRRGEEERVLLSNIVNVAMSQFTNPRRLSLRLRNPGKFGDEIVFIPATSYQWNPFARNPIAEQLIKRVDQARQER